MVIAIGKVEDHFVNEKGNPIRMVVTGDLVSVKIWMQGPDSQTTNEITRVEALKLRDLLNQVLDPQVVHVAYINDYDAGTAEGVYSTPELAQAAIAKTEGTWRKNEKWDVLELTLDAEIDGLDT